ncbi:hypothetical protein GEMRC1_014019 [Eukaryota sp. GEM-RC1]
MLNHPILRIFIRNLVFWAFWQSPSQYVSFDDNCNVTCSLHSKSLYEIALFDQVLDLAHKRSLIRNHLSQPSSSIVATSVVNSFINDLHQLDLSLVAEFENSSIESLSHLATHFPQLSALYSFIHSYLESLPPPDTPQSQQTLHIIHFLYKSSRDNVDAPYNCSSNALSAAISSYWTILSQWMTCSFTSSTSLSESFIRYNDQMMTSLRELWTECQVDQDAVPFFISQKTAQDVLFCGKVSFLCSLKLPSLRTSIDFFDYQSKMIDMLRLPSFSSSLLPKVSRELSIVSVKAKTLSSSILWRLLHQSQFSVGNLTNISNISGICGFLTEVGDVALHLDGSFSNDFVNYFSEICFIMKDIPFIQNKVKFLWETAVSEYNYSDACFSLTLNSNHQSNMIDFPETLDRWNQLRFRISPPTPFELIFSKEMEEFYNSEFLLIFLLKIAYSQLLCLFDGGYPKSIISAPRMLNVLKQELLFVLQTFLGNYLMLLSHHHSKMIDNLLLVSTFDDAVSGIDSYLSQVSRFSMTNNPKLTIPLFKIVDIVIKTQSQLLNSFIDNDELNRKRDSLRANVKILCTVLTSLKSPELRDLVQQLESLCK